MKTTDNTNTVVVDLSSDIQLKFDNATPKQRQDIAYKYIMDNLRGCYKATDGRIVSINKKSADKLSHTPDELKIRVTSSLADAIEKAEFIGTATATHGKFDNFAYYQIIFNIGGKLYSGVINVGILLREKSAVLYTVNQLTEINPN